MSGILTDLAIQSAVETGDIVIDPFTPEHLNITSYDLTLGTDVKAYTHAKDAKFINHTHGKVAYPNTLDVKQQPGHLANWEIGESGFVLYPGVGYLMHTQERVATTKYNPILDGKSSIARMFIQVHATAGYLGRSLGFSGFLPYDAGVYLLEPDSRPVGAYTWCRFRSILSFFWCNSMNA